MYTLKSIVQYALYQVFLYLGHNMFYIWVTKLSHLVQQAPLGSASRLCINFCAFVLSVTKVGPRHLLLFNTVVMHLNTVVMHVPHSESLFNFYLFITDMVTPVFTINRDSLTGRSNCTQMHCDWLVPGGTSSSGLQLPIWHVFIRLVPLKSCRKKIPGLVKVTSSQ